MTARFWRHCAWRRMSSPRNKRIGGERRDEQSGNNHRRATVPGDGATGNSTEQSHESLEPTVIRALGHVAIQIVAAWLEGATDADIHAIKQAMEKRQDARAAFLDFRSAISAVNAATNRPTQIVIRPPKSPEFGSSFAVGKDLSDSSLRNASKIKWRRGWDSNPRAGITRPSDFESAPL
jgi:hypothetical protein